MNLSEEFWDNKYKSGETGWDLGQVSPPLKAYFDQIDNKDLTILIPGGGNSYEAEYLHNLGFMNVFIADISATVLTNIHHRVPTFPQSNLLHKNFFDLKMSFDLIIEQTFFCAINPDLRPAYANKAAELLNQNGKLVGLLFDTVFGNDYPPFGGSASEYKQYFEPNFNLLIMETCYNSHPARQGRELFVIFERRF